MHVFIDTNILLSFYHYSSDELDVLHNVFADHEHGSATVYVTEQVKDEYVRNREVKIKDALKKFNDSKINPQFPSFMKGHEEYDKLRELARQAKLLKKSILLKVQDSIDQETLPADVLIADIFKYSRVSKVTAKRLEAAEIRMARGNPPGKKNSLGDAINWEILLEEVTDGNDLHIVSADGDYFSTLNENNPGFFIRKEWKKKKKADVFVYRTLSEFTKEHFDGIAFSYDKEKQSLIDQLKTCGNFASTHDVIAKLETYTYFSLKEVEGVLDAAVDNDQFGRVVTDYDVSDFLNKHAVPRYSELKNEKHKKILAKVIDEQKERAADV